MSDPVHLRIITSDVRERDIAELYWSQDDDSNFEYRVREIAETYEISEREVREIASSAAAAESTTSACSSCGGPRTFKSRHDAQYRAFRNKFVCENCRRELAEHQERAREELAAHKRELIQQHYLVPEDRSPNVRGLRLEHAVALQALLRVCASENGGRIDPIQTSSKPIAPGTDYIYDLLKELTSAGLIFVDPNSATDAFDWEIGEPERYYLDRVCWRLPGPPTELSRVRAELACLHEIDAWPEHWTKQSRRLQMNLASHEMADYLVDRFAEHHFEFSPGDKTWEILDQICDSYSIGQGYNLIWRATRDAASFYVREECDPGRAKAYGIGALRRSFERAASAGWDIKAYRRPWGIEESEMVHIFYRLCLGVEDPVGVEPIALTDSQE